MLKRCNYAPSAIAQGMVSKSLHTVAVLTVDIRDSHYARTAYTIEREFGRRGYEVILCNTGGDRAETLRTLQAVAQKQVDGLILVGSIFNTICQGAEMENLLRKMPVVLANGTLALPDAYSVMVDDCRGVEMAVEHLVKTGRRNLYYIKDKSTDSAAAKAKASSPGWPLPVWTQTGIFSKPARRWRTASARCSSFWPMASARTAFSAVRI